MNATLKANSLYELLCEGERLMKGFTENLKDLVKQPKAMVPEEVETIFFQHLLQESAFSLRLWRLIKEYVADEDLWPRWMEHVLRNDTALCEWLWERVRESKRNS